MTFLFFALGSIAFYVALWMFFNLDTNPVVMRPLLSLTALFLGVWLFYTGALSIIDKAPDEDEAEDARYLRRLRQAEKDEHGL